MTLGYIARASKRVLVKYGQDAFLRGAPAGKVAVLTDLVNAPGRMDDANDNHVASIKVAVIGSEFDPRVGDELVHPDGTFTLDRKIEDTGYVRHFVIC
jgi:hypothetical protein